MDRTTSLWLVAASAATMAGACAKERVDKRPSLVTAYCEAVVTGVGALEVETEYIPNVVSCENGAAGLEALKAQAVAARSYLYYRLDREGMIGDGQHEQVYGCGRVPSMLTYMAADATSGEVIMYRGIQVAGFYVAGAKQAPPSCTGGQRDPTSTEAYVTYNQGKSGGQVLQTNLGFVHPENQANRGCKSQNGATCLAEAGWTYDEILRFYYGEDIEIVKAEGPCVTPFVPHGSHGERERRGVPSPSGTPGVRAGLWLASLAGAAIFLAIRGRYPLRGRRRTGRGRRARRRARGR